MAKNDPASLYRAMPDKPPLLSQAAARQARHGKVKLPTLGIGL